MANITDLGSTYTGGSGGSTDSGRPVRQLGAYRTANTPPPYVPPNGGGTDTGATPGTYDISPLQPGESAANALQETEGGLAGMKNALFGVSQPDANGQHGGLLGDIPLVGDATRALSETVANVGSTVGGVGHNILAGVGGALEHVDLNSEQTHAQTQQAFDALPDSPAKQEAVTAIAQDPGATGHYMAKAIDSYNAENRAQGIMDGKPDFTTGAFKTPGSAAETVDDLMGLMGLTARWAERTFEGIGTPGQGGMDRLGTIKAVGDGQIAFNPDKGILGTGILAGESTSGLNAIEAIVYKKVYQDKEWTPDQGRDFLAANNAGYSHSAIANLAGNVALDPMNLAGLGAAGIAKIGETGAKIVEAARVADEAVSVASDALDAAKIAGKTTDEINALDHALTEAQRAAKVANEGAYKIGGNVSRLNPLGHLARNEEVTNLVKNIYKTYEPLQAIHVDKALKVTRAIVDPLGAITLHNPFRKQMLDLMTDDVTKTVIGAMGDGNHARVVHLLTDATEGDASPVADAFSEGMGIYSGNLTRRVIARTQRDAAIASGKIKNLMRKGVNETIADLGDTIPKSMQEHVLREANLQRIHAWDETGVANLGKRMADNFGVKSPEEWTSWLKDKGLNADQMSLIHQATYGIATKRLLRAVEKVRPGEGGELRDKLHRLILINVTTLTKQGAEGIVERIRGADNMAAKIAEVTEAQRKYPELRGFTLDMTDGANSAERFADQLERKVPAFPTQVIDKELADLPDELRGLHTDDAYTLGLAPQEEYRWGLERSNMAGGEYAPTYDVWPDHVASGLGTGYRTPGRLVETNLAGQPILGHAGKALGRSIDYIDAGIKTLNRRVSGTLIHESARMDFIQNASMKYGKVGITDQVARKIMDDLEEAVKHQDLVVRPSGFSTKQMWEFAKDAIPTGIRPADFGPRDLLSLMLDAYKGDMRYVGLTQAFSSRVKRVLAFESNNASVLAEQAYPMLKYRLNVIFQAQEKIEPWVLNTMRGVTPARSVRRMSAADQKTLDLLEMLEQKSLVSNADHEMAEYSGRLLYGKNIEDLARGDGNALAEVTKKLGLDWATLRDVKGVKQVNMLRTFRSGMGKTLRQAWDDVEPGLFDRMYSEAVRKAERGAGGLDEDEFAVSMLAENLMGNGVTVERGADGLLHAHNIEAALNPGLWSAPQTLGGLRGLDLDDMTRHLGFETTGGRTLKTQGELRSALASGEIKMEDVTKALRQLNANPDYIMRVKSALEFSWTGFWGQAARDFNLTPEQAKFYQDVIGNAANVHNMTPIDYLSQVLVPTIGQGDTAPVLGHLGQIMDMLGPEGKVIGQKADLGALRVMQAGEGTEDQFVNQLATIFSAHLDPSSKKTLLAAFSPELKARLVDAHDISMETVASLWTPEMDRELAARVLGEINKPVDLAARFEAGLLRSVKDWDEVDPGVVTNLVKHDGTVVAGAPVTRFIGDGLRTAPHEVQVDVMHALGRIHAEFPGVDIRHIDISDNIENYLDAGEDGFGVAGVAVDSADGGQAIILNSHYYGKHPTKSYQQVWSDYHATNEAARAQTQFAHDTVLGVSWEPRESVMGAGQGALAGPRDTVVHEMSHLIDQHVERKYNALVAAGKGKTMEARKLGKVVKFRDTFESSLAGHRIGEYARTNTNEAMAELGSIAFFGKSEEEALAAARKIDAATAKGAAERMTPKTFDPAPKIETPADLDHFHAYVMDNLPGYDMTDWNGLAREWEGALEDGDLQGANEVAQDLFDETNRIKKEIEAENKDILKGHLADLKSLGRGPQTVEDAVKQYRTLMDDARVHVPPPVKSDYAAGANGIEPVVAEDPEVQRAVQHFGKWTTAVMADGIRHGGNAQHASTLEKIGMIPTHAATAHNATEEHLVQATLDSMRSKWDDAHRLQYYSRQRTMLERSANHPIFGIYPASYMWGKMLPEMMHFMARTPFGIHTGAAAYSYMDTVRNVALQREFDPGFDKKITDLGHSAAFFALGYMMPSWPWESSAAAPTWARTMAQQGLDMQSRADLGGVVGNSASSSGVNMDQAAQKGMDLINPLKPIERTILNPAKELTGGGTKPEGTSLFGEDDGTSQPVAGADLGNPLTDALSTLRNLFGGGG